MKRATKLQVANYMDIWSDGLLALVTIGQSPRDDITYSMFGAECPSRLIQCGALDSLSRETIISLAPGGGESLLVSTLRSGEEVLLSKKRIMPHVQRAVDVAIASGATTVCILCTGDFGAIDGRHVGSVTVDSLLKSVVNSLIPEGVLGILSPHDLQRDAMIEKWRTQRRAVHVEAISPYGVRFETGDAARGFRESGANLIVMDCMGFDRTMQRTLERDVDCPVLLSNGAIGAVLQELAYGLDAVDNAL